MKKLPPIQIVWNLLLGLLVVMRHNADHLPSLVVSAFSIPTTRIEHLTGLTQAKGGILGESRRTTSFFPISNRSTSSTYLHSSTTDADTTDNNNSATEQTQQQIEELGRERLQKFFSFPIDSWQAQAGGEILLGRNVIVCAPTGAGKTVVGEMALHDAFERGDNAIYTTPLKALSNQKFAELRKIFGSSNVGLSTGDMSINRGARITVMTTEVYRNMAWRASSSSTTTDNNDDYDDEYDENAPISELASNSVVVLDEFHYMGQPGRGGVWEECVITSPHHTQIIGLSATLPNADRLGMWMEQVTERDTTLVEAGGGRPVPLRYMFATKNGLEFLFRDFDAGPGAPKGMLGWRGDGVSSVEDGSRDGENVDGNIKGKKKQKKKKKKQRSDDNDDVFSANISYPIGLQMNPILKKLGQKRIEKIDKMVARKALGIEFDKDFNRSRGRGRDRGRGDDGDSGRSSKPYRKMSARDERRERERLLKSEMRKAVPSLHFLLRRLNQKELLPAIFFLFSRAGCDEAAASVCQYMHARTKLKQGNDSDVNGNSDDAFDGKRKKRKGRSRGRNRGSIVQDKNGRSFRAESNYVDEDTMSSILDNADVEGVEELDLFETEKLKTFAEQGLLTLDGVKQVAARVTAFNAENEEIKFDDQTIKQFLHGVGSHHAGQLPAHKAFAEALFRTQLMKVVFATETLAAGINMPARTTVICSMAKRGGGSTMNLLETANLLQMAGRAGRRGMDTDGTCVVVATPFEGPEEAVEIITNEIKPVESQFSPSYSLAINLIARGGGKLHVAQNLVMKSFAMWEKQQLEERIESAKEVHGENFDDVIETAAQERFLTKLKDILSTKIKKNPTAKGRYERVFTVLDDRILLKKASKSFIGMSQILELESNTLRYLEQEQSKMNSLESDIDSDGLRELLEEDTTNIEAEVTAQKDRVFKCEKDVSNHVMTDMAIIANSFTREMNDDAEFFRSSLILTRKSDPSVDPESPVTPGELTKFAKAFVTMNRKQRKQKSATNDVGLDNASLVGHLSEIGTFEDDSWKDMRALVNVLKSYGCLVASSEESKLEDNSFDISVAGEDVGQLGFENSLWCLVAMGGAWDVSYESIELDKFKLAMDTFNDSFDPDESGLFSENEMDENLHDDEDKNTVPKPQSESATLVSQLRSLEPSELAGYVSCLVADGVRGGSTSTLAAFTSLSPTQQRVIQSSLLALDRLVEVQKKFNVDENTRKVQLELGTCEVVTAWTAGCTWTEALEISGSAPGDLVRTLHRALDALRQFGNLPVNAVRSLDSDSGIVQKVAPGIHPDIRQLCKEAARAMDRYPVKDPLPFDDEDDVNEESKKDENEVQNEDGDESDELILGDPNETTE